MVWYRCAPAAYLKSGIQQEAVDMLVELSSVILKMWVCVPTLIHNFFSLNASCNMNFHTLYAI